MVLLNLKEAPDGWEALRGAGSSALDARLSLSFSSAASGGGPVLIFVSADDVDALAAARVITRLLRADLTRYELHPVHGYDHLADKFNALADAVQPRAALLVNCGAMVDLAAVLRLEHRDRQSDVRVFVMDCHRPYHLRNIRNNRVVLFDDLEENSQVNLPLDVNWEDQWGNIQEDDSSSDEDSDESDRDDYDDDDDDDELQDGERERKHLSSGSPDNSRGESSQPEKSASPQRKRKRRRRRDDDDEDMFEDDVVFDGEGSGEGTDEEGEQGQAQSASRKKNRKKNRRRRMRRRYDPEIKERQRLREYYANATVAMSSACLSHSIAAVLRRSNIDTLWMAIVGVTSQFKTSMISSELYDDARGYFIEQLKDPKLNGQKQEEGSSREQHVGYAASCNAMQAHRIAPNTELQLDLLRHWSLYESLLFSTYTATRLSAWRQTGRRRLLEMLATLGIPLRESQQDWCYMKQKSKLALDNHLHKAIRRFDLGEKIEYDSFVRSLPGHKGDISAADFSHAIAALLEFDDRPQREHLGDFSSSLKKFWRAYDALDMSKTNLLDIGLDMAISVQRLTAEIGGDVIERRKFVPSGPFRYVFLRDQQSKELLSHPLLLRRLALFLKKALTRQGAREKPFIILAPDPSKNKWLAVAATTSGQKNDFGHRFRKAAERNGSTVTYDAFDSAVCEINDGQEIEFVRFLHDVMR